jgi:PAS domain S-box-containing protein
MNNFNVLFYSSPLPMWVFDVNTLFILEVNQAAINFYGFTKEEFLIKRVTDLRPPEDIPLVESALTLIRSSQTNFREFRHMDKNGRVFYVEIMSYPIVFNDIAARLVIAQNIDEKKAIVGQLEITKTKLNKILESTSIGFFQTDLNSNITYWNTAAEKAIGYTRDYVLGKNIWDVLTEAVDSDLYDQYHKAMQERVNVEFNFYYWPIQKWFAVNAYPVVDGLIMHFRDITENKNYEERLLEKIEQLQEVSYLNSHYIRKPVATLLGLTNLITEGIVKENEYRDVASHIQECSVELDNIVREINIKVNDDFTGSLTNELSNFSITELVKELIEKYHHKKPVFNITLKGDREIEFYGNKPSIKIALNCLLNNAIKFTNDPKKIEVCLELIDNSVVFSVKDNGIGIDSKTINNIFINFTKKSTGKQIGSGLSKVSQVAHRHNGNIWVESKPGKGSVFSMRLPVSNMASLNQFGITGHAETAHGVKISFNKDAKYVVTSWYGFQSLHSIKSGCLKILKAVVDNNCRMILNDNTGVIGTWNEAVEWVVNEYFPMLQNANVTHIAWVYSKSTFSRLSTDLTLNSLAGGIITKTFNNKKAADRWLAQIKNQPDIEKNYKPE